jgi:hypothetical protein
VNITQRDFWWLCKHQPLLAAGMSGEAAEGTLKIWSYYDRDAGRVISGRHLTVQSHHTFVTDRFAIRIEFDAGDITGWPKVHETGLRYRSIARRHKIPVEDMHFYPTGEACLGFEYPWDPALTLEYFLTDIVEPFFYRLAYVDLYGLTAARTDLWLEHSHGIAGLIEHREDVRRGLRVRQSSENSKKRIRAPKPR